SRTAAEFTAPQDKMNIPACTETICPSFSTSAEVTIRPEGSLTNRRTKLRVQSVTEPDPNAGRTQFVSVSALAETRHGNPSQVRQRIHNPPSRQSTPIGR